MDHPLLHKPKFIEASAGTGKTHLIMEMLGDIMIHDVKNNISENRILNTLILTFTEKAAGELKARLKTKILELSENGSKPGFYRYLRDLDQVTISTIHGFCNMVLKEYPIETQNNPNVRLTNAEEIINKSFYLLKRNHWGETNFDELAKNLIESKTLEKESSITFAVSKLLSNTKDYFFPEVLSLEKTIISPHLEKIISNLTQVIHTLRGPLGLSIVEQGDKRTIQKWIENWMSLDVFLSALLSKDTETLKNELQRIGTFQRTAEKVTYQGFNYLLLSGKTITKNLSKEAIIVQSSIEGLISLLNETFPIDKIDLNGDWFLQKTAFRLLEDTKLQLKSGDLLTYDQMILKVHETVVTSPNKTLIQSLKERYQVCILDEFQDTDKNQYQIFKTLFVDSEDKTRMLFCIGDPKQSIYGFRGADIGIYLEAVSDFADSIDSLSTNYRSTVEIIEGLNLLFYNKEKELGETSFFPIEEPGSTKANYQYHPVKAPKDSEIKYKYSNQNEYGIHVIQYEDHFPNVNKARNAWAESIKKEILSFQQKSQSLSYFKKGEKTTQSVQLKDIAVLCGSKKETELIEKTLSKAGIPCSIYKQRGIFQSREADQIENLLECLIQSNSSRSYKRILFSDLFSVQPKDLNKYNEHSIDSYEKSLIDVWLKLIRDNRYAAFFRSVMDETKIFWNHELKNLEWERKRTNYRQIFQRLLEFQIQTNANLPELLAELKQLKQRKTSPEEEPLFDRETEDDAVQILTIHASKGLEWPIVFLYYFGTRPQSLLNYEYPTLIQDKNLNERKWILSLWDAKDGKQNEHKHFLNEQKRLLYVALTRPNLRLYLPKLSWGKDSLQKSGYGNILFTELERIEEYNKSHVNQYFVFRNEIDHPQSEIQKKTQAIKSPKKGSLKTVVLPTEIKAGRILLQHSYTSLQTSQTLLTKTQEESFKEIEEPLEPELIKSKTKLPSSSKTGNFLHRILELCDFSIFKLKIEEILIHPSWIWAYTESFRQYPIKFQSDTKESLDLVVATLLKRAMTAEITLADGDSFSLSDLTLEEKSSELKFHLYIQKMLEKSGVPLSPGFENYLKGAIDLVFYKNGKYYIADYKSNLLPNDLYDKDAVTSAVIEKGYMIQKSVYALILYDYLSSLFGNELALERFGGVYYLFLRGMGMSKDSGIYSDLKSSQTVWTEETFLEIRKEILTYIRDAAIGLEKLYL
ncbi:UvrD-helicase domain-containing protein [Leptospira sp. 2 VSF19]|uniref:RecBCD enzyme subunit RecB n=1 Tax=Leptospira soteropolitanensis TaxID=2950025 RepID=A0AAW5VFE8_9LEPT|nr:UvrD-helicase domain-containing protein [Leptospira soteropolitanensis]MCW7492514.1 UvrD-helicase domain-containing protein [Leptospira soteropolitanensis]MCW7500563.1 UvrD-helicase domain-containing protein [Leptospira soteropolitanensis]MCW7522767.1 UvrD-helicase domain-containing protein [Leptospira soteropolitanensis]MCW7526624.1 UvrD-helicase domain-containing protein [Leptospira soteropolitanensis]MCW7530533.1 UvrD-helicase domain-containing protein [Leptospira soteropolitanensis]